jgi:hypothetical protein
MSKHLSGSTPKELHYFDRPDIEPLSAYLDNFSQLPDDSLYLYESTPNYFCMPDPTNQDSIDVAARIRCALGDIPLILMLRNPIDRYKSAYVHHMGKGRVPRVDVISQMHSTFGMLEFGRYASILKHYKSYFSRINIHLYDELKSDAYDLIKSILGELGVENDIAKGRLQFTTNTSRSHLERMGLASFTPPELSSSLRSSLAEYYYNEIVELQLITGIELTHWLSSQSIQEP